MTRTTPCRSQRHRTRPWRPLRRPSRASPKLEPPPPPSRLASPLRTSFPSGCATSLAMHRALWLGVCMWVCGCVGGRLHSPCSVPVVVPSYVMLPAVTMAAKQLLSVHVTTSASGSGIVIGEDTVVQFDGRGVLSGDRAKVRCGVCGDGWLLMRTCADVCRGTMIHSGSPGRTLTRAVSRLLVGRVRWKWRTLGPRSLSRAPLIACSCATSSAMRTTKRTRAYHATPTCACM